jgi:hypothetical protein
MLRLEIRAAHANNFFEPLAFSTLPSGWHGGRGGNRWSSRYSRLPVVVGAS